MVSRADLQSSRTKQAKDVVSEPPESPDSSTVEEAKPIPPLYWKLMALDINNQQFSLLEASEDFMTTLLILFAGILTDRIGGTGAMLTETNAIKGNVIYTVGSIIVAAAALVRSFKLMIGGRVIIALGDIATQVAQYRVFSSWLPPNNGFASTLGLELGIKKIGGFVGKPSAYTISKNTGDFAWLFNGTAQTRFRNVDDPATGEKPTEKSKKFEPKKILELPWAFWAIMAFSLFETSTAVVFTQNATGLAEKRLDTDSITAG
ncbi:hypothetical protein S40285_09255 [Stachybotrys chlorohalonatus IBT 40285]|uniref:Major facilitator superfamily (MFS) profile domain-containing protein n=1 Tax=Stachybotrys chlorohalonatus (strain IBT 40285) TaxID=1283841 RepID=A0A084QZV1_STAC4|nr:hypothetical protein S40285_09255 [Stachybotrys chlorohalonata IBT 40285]